MYGLDRAAIYTEVQTDILYVRERVKKLFPKSFVESLSNHANTYNINEKNINFIKLEEKKIQKKTIIKIDFSYPRFFADNNIVPLDNELQKIMVEQSLVILINKIIDYEITLDDLSYDYFEFTTQENIKNFYKYHNIITFFYRGLVRKYEDLDKVQYYNFNKIENKFYTTGFIFQPFQGWKIKLYSKGHENNKKKTEKIQGAIIRLEHRLSKKFIKNFFKLNNVRYISIEEIKDCIKNIISKKLSDILIEEIKKSNELLIKNFKDFRCRDLDSLVRDNLDWILDYKILDDIITPLSNRSYRRIVFYRQKIKEILKNSQARASPQRDFFDNVKRLEIFFSNLILSDIKVKCNTKNHLTFFYAK